MDIQHPTAYEIKNLCVPAIELFLNKPDTFSGVHNRKGKLTSNEQQTRLNGIHKESRISGAQLGAQFRYESLQNLLESSTVRNSLDRVFNFATVMNDAKIVPPVISQVEGSVELAGDRQSARTTQRSWRIIKPARITTARLNWRTYLNLGAMASTQTHSISAYFVPLNRKERNAWKTGFCNGYEVGYQQADRQFIFQLSELRRDFLGMWRFKQLEMQGIVSSPQVIETRLGTLVNDDVVFIDERDVRISEVTKFRAQSSWHNTQMK